MLSEEIIVYEYFKTILKSIKLQEFTIEICKNPAKVFKLGLNLLKFILDLLQKGDLFQEKTFVYHNDIISQ